MLKKECKAFQTEVVNAVIQNQVLRPIQGCDKLYSTEKVWETPSQVGHNSLSGTLIKEFRLDESKKTRGEEELQAKGISCASKYKEYHMQRQ